MKEERVEEKLVQQLRHQLLPWTGGTGKAKKHSKNISFCFIFLPECVGHHCVAKPESSCGKSVRNGSTE